MATKPGKKCAHTPCDCMAAEGSKYCSAYCEGAGDRTDVVCHCGHPDCEGEVATAR